MAQEELVANETISLIAADKVEGTPVHNTNDENLGTVDKLMIDKYYGVYGVPIHGGAAATGGVGRWHATFRSSQPSERWVKARGADSFGDTPPATPPLARAGDR